MSHRSGYFERAAYADPAGAGAALRGGGPDREGRRAERHPARGARRCRTCAADGKVAVPVVLEATGDRSARRAGAGRVAPRALRLRASARTAAVRDFVAVASNLDLAKVGRRACARAACRRTRPSRCRPGRYSLRFLLRDGGHAAGAARTGWTSASRTPSAGEVVLLPPLFMDDPQRLAGPAGAVVARTSGDDSPFRVAAERVHAAPAPAARERARAARLPAGAGRRPRLRRGRVVRDPAVAHGRGRRAGAVRRLPAVAGGGRRRRLPPLRPELHAVGRAGGRLQPARARRATRRPAGWASRSSRCAWSKTRALARLFRPSWVVPVQPSADRATGASPSTDGRVAWVGGPGDPGAPAGEVRDLGPGVLLPGLVNAHCHLELSHLAGRSTARRGGFVPWVEALVARARRDRRRTASARRPRAAIRAARSRRAPSPSATSRTRSRTSTCWRRSRLRAVVFYELHRLGPGAAPTAILDGRGRACWRSPADPPRTRVAVRLAAHAPHSVSPALLAAHRRARRARRHPPRGVAGRERASWRAGDGDVARLPRPARPRATCAFDAARAEPGRATSTAWACCARACWPRTACRWTRRTARCWRARGVFVVALPAQQPQPRRRPRARARAARRPACACAWARTAWPACDTLDLLRGRARCCTAQFPDARPGGRSCAWRRAGGARGARPRRPGRASRRAQRAALAFAPRPRRAAPTRCALPRLRRGAPAAGAGVSALVGARRRSTGG